MKKFIAYLSFVILSASVSAADMAAYRLFDNEGKEISFDVMTDSLAKADVVFIGENHNCPISHWMELNITEALHRIHGQTLVLGEEMLESDNQVILDEYMHRQIPFDGSKPKRDCGTTSRPTIIR